MAEQADNPKRDIIEIVEKKRHIHLLEKVQKGKVLTAAEKKELSKYEQGPLSPAILDNQDQVARAFGVSSRTVRNWMKEEGFPNRADGRYDLREIQSWRFLKGNKPKNPDKETQMELWEAKYREFKAKKEEIEYRTLLGELVEKDQIEEGLINVSIAIKRALLTLPRSMAPKLVGLDAREINKELTDKVKEIINLFATDRIWSKVSHDSQRKSV